MKNLQACYACTIVTPLGRRACTQRFVGIGIWQQLQSNSLPTHFENLERNETLFGVSFSVIDRVSFTVQICVRGSYGGCQEKKSKLPTLLAFRKGNVPWQPLHENLSSMHFYVSLLA